MKILLTGGCGFIGCNLVRHLLASSEHQLINVDKLTYAANPRSLEDLGIAPRYSLERGDIVDRRMLRAVFQRHDPDAVLHLAAESHVDRSIDAPDDFIQSNIVGTYSLLQESRRHYEGLSPARRRWFRFLHVSTDEVFGSLRESQPPFDETSRYDPRSPYSATKGAADHLVRAWATTYQLPVIVTHSSNNYGPYQHPEKLVPMVITRALQGLPIGIYGDGRQIRDWLHVSDHARALRLVLESGQVGQTYNIGGDNPWRNIDLARALCQLLDQRLPPKDNPRLASRSQRPTSYGQLIRFTADRPGHDFRYALNCTWIQQQLDWHPSIHGDRGFRETVDWYLDNNGWWQEAAEPARRSENTISPLHGSRT